MPGEPTIDISAEVPLLLGVIGSAEDVAAVTPALGHALGAILRGLRERYPQTPLVVLSPSIAGAEVAAIHVAGELGIPTRTSFGTADNARDVIAYASDILFVASHGPLPADLVAFAQRRGTGEPPPAGTRKLLAPPDVGPYFLFEGDLVQRFYPPRYSGDEESEDAFAEALSRRNRYNLDLRGVRAPTGGTGLERLQVRTEVVTDALQVKTRAGQRVLYTLALLAALVQVVTFNPIGPYAKFSAVILAFLVYFYVRRQDYQNRYQDCRAIAEALRVQAVWSALGLADGAGESYLPMQQTDLQWIRMVLRAVHLMAPAEAQGVNGYDVVLPWVAHQQRYFAEHARTEARNRNRFARAASTLGSLSLLASLVVLGIHIARASVVPTVLADIGFVAALAAVCVAVVKSYSQTLGHSENANRYQRMSFVFERAMDLLKKAETETEIRTIARELGREALAEHAEWLLINRQRPISIVQASAI